MFETMLFPQGIWPVDFNTGANPGDYVSLKDYQKLGILISQNTAAGTAAVTLVQAKDVAATGAKALAFTRYWMTGVKLNYDGATGRFTVGETVTGAGGGSGVVYYDNGSYLLLYTVNATAFVDNEVLTGGTSGTTASADGIGINEDIMLPVDLAAGVNTFTIPAVAQRKYGIEITPDMLDRANDYDCVRVHIAQATAAGIGSCVYILEDGKSKTVPMPTAIYN
jgi:hypothetical protein